MTVRAIAKKIFTKRKMIISLIIIILFPIFAVILSDSIIKSTSKNFFYSDITKVPENKVGMVLGTSKHLSNGQINLYYKYRIDAAVSLYKAGKIKYIVVIPKWFIKQSNNILNKS